MENDHEPEPEETLTIPGVITAPKALETLSQERTKYFNRNKP